MKCQFAEVKYVKTEGEVNFDAGEFFKTISILVVTYVELFKLRIPSQILQFLSLLPKHVPASTTLHPPFIAPPERY